MIILVSVTVLSARGATEEDGLTIPRPAEKQMSEATEEMPSVAELHAYKAYHHARYMETTVAQTGGTNKLSHTRSLPSEGKDAVVSPALDHLYSKAVIDLSSGPVTVEFPEEGLGDLYWSIHITDQEHYTIFDEYRPTGSYTFVRTGKDMAVKPGSKVIECPEDYPHLFIRIQVKTPDVIEDIWKLQDKIKLTGVSKKLEIDNYIQFTLDTHDIYPENEGLLESVVDFNDDDYARVTKYLFIKAPSYPSTLGMYGPIDSPEPGSDDPVTRAVAIFGHLGLPALHAIYFPNFVNCDGEILMGENTEVLTFPYEPVGVKEFWPITRCRRQYNHNLQC
jgi:hypothetical protein